MQGRPSYGETKRIASQKFKGVGNKDVQLLKLHEIWSYEYQENH